MAFVSNTVIQIDIEGRKFTLNVIKKGTVDAIKTIAEKMKSFSEAGESATEEEFVKRAEKVLNDCKVFINSVLGVDAFDKIMDGKEMDLLYIMEVAKYILNEYSKAKNKRLSRFNLS